MNTVIASNGELTPEALEACKALLINPKFLMPV